MEAWDGGVEEVGPLATMVGQQEEETTIFLEEAVDTVIIDSQVPTYLFMVRIWIQRFDSVRGSGSRLKGSISSVFLKENIILSTKDFVII